MGIFREDPTRTILHDVRVWISGIEVTARLSSSVSVSINGRGGINTVNFSLSNASDGFILTDENLAGRFRLGGQPGEYGEQIKFALWQFKSSETTNPTEPSTGQRRWPLTAGSAILHSLDPIMVAARWPYSKHPRWVCRFKGYLSDRTFDEDSVTGKKSVQVSGFDIRALMAYMRVQMNYLIANEATAVSTTSLGTTAPANALLNAFDPVKMDGLIADLQLPTNLSTPLAQLSFEETVRLLIVGGTFDTKKVLGGSDGEANTGFLEDALRSVSGVSVDEDTEDGPGLSRELAGVQASTDDTVDVRAIGRFKFDIGTVYWPSSTGNSTDDIEIMESWHRLCMFGLENGGEPWTTTQLELHAANCTWDGDTAPHACQLLMLMPSAGSGMSALTEYTQDSTATTRTWSSRKAIIDELMEKLDYQWYVTGSGDIAVEFPMYDMEPSQFGEWDAALTIDMQGEGKTLQYSDDKPEIPTVVQATGAYDPSGTGNSELFADVILRGDGMSLSNTRVTLIAPNAMGLLGVRVEQVSFPYVTDVCRLRQFATLFFQRKLAEANSASVTFIYRPLMLPNRPVHVRGTTAERMGWIGSVSESFARVPEHGQPNTSISLQYIRRRTESGEFTLVTGSKYMPLSYSGAGPLLNPERGIRISESRDPSGPTTSINSTCPDDSLTGAPTLDYALSRVATGSAGLSDNVDSGECSTSEDDLTATARERWQKLRQLALDRYKLELTLTCTTNPGTQHESVSPYLHNERPSSAFDIDITRQDGTPGTADDFAAVGALSAGIGLSWGGSSPTVDSTIEQIQAKIATRLAYHVSRRTPYVWGGNGPDDPAAAGYPGCDCAGLVVDVYRYAGILKKGEDYGAGTLRDLFPAVTGREPRTGELVFYNSGSTPGSSATHVGIISGAKGADGTYPIVCASGPGSAANSTATALANGWHVKSRTSHLYRSDFVGFGAVYDVVAASVGYLNHFSAAATAPSIA